MTTVHAIVLAGGSSRRFGSDKLMARLGARRLLEEAVRDLPPDAQLVIVGPVRDGLAFDRPTSYVREDPPGGGPAAALVAGLRAALAQETTVREDPAGGGPAAARVAGLRAALAQETTDDAFLLVLPGDTPAAGKAATVLLEALRRGASDAVAVVGVDAGGREQHLQLALRPTAARRLIAAAGSAGGQGASARTLLGALGDDLQRLSLPDRLHADIDTPADLARWRP